jgi:hypothetical protein
MAIVQNFDGVAVEDGDDGAGDLPSAGMRGGQTQTGSKGDRESRYCESHRYHFGTLLIQGWRGQQSNTVLQHHLGMDKFRVSLIENIETLGSTPSRPIVINNTLNKPSSVFLRTLQSLVRQNL